MFERFTDPARRVVVLAQEEARTRGDDRIGSEHLLLGICRATDTHGAALLAARGVTLREVEDDLRAPEVPDRDALASVGIDLDEVRDRVEEAFGPGALESTR
ncbi:MAG TPA: Clp protease N-terminal domain-containing protein, partial [Actinomycetospora sp.]|nr:Clp protease N-terminal domain-containing protein [Actinomycetospora sp.]